MLGKKSTPVSPFTLQVLTTDYLIEGTTDGNTELNFSDSDPLILSCLIVNGSLATSQTEPILIQR